MNNKVFLFFVGVLVGAFVTSVICISLGISAVWTGSDIHGYPVNGSCAYYPVITPADAEYIVGLIDNATEYVYVECYLMTNEDIMNALLRAHRRGVTVRILLDKTVDLNKDAFITFAENGVDVKWAPEVYPRTHAKMIIIDGRILFIGSSNFTYHGFSKNREANIVLVGCDIESYKSMFEKDWKLAG
ncbi:phospholipase D family protein [Candidatus Micrarchaeota archaeon]|nr:phospholipase D family protein [Candidatus Micrarchaeota archaeon]